MPLETLKKNQLYCQEWSRQLAKKAMRMQVYILEGKISCKEK